MTGKLSNVCFQFCVKRKKRTRRYEMLCVVKFHHCCSLLCLISLLPRMTLYEIYHHLLPKGGSSKDASLNCIQLKIHSFYTLYGPLRQVKTPLLKDPLVFWVQQVDSGSRGHIDCPQSGHPRRVGKIISWKGLIWHDTCLFGPIVYQHLPAALSYQFAFWNQKWF